MAGVSGFRTTYRQVAQALRQDHSHREINNRPESADLEELHEADKPVVHKLEPEEERQAEAGTAQPERHAALGSLHIYNQDCVKENRYITVEPIPQPYVDHKKGESYYQCSGYCVCVCVEIHKFRKTTRRWN